MLKKVGSWILLLVLMLSWAPSAWAGAGVFELSGHFSFSENRFGTGSYQSARRWGISFGYYVWSLSEIEISVQDVIYKTVIEGAQETTFHDQIYSLDWVQSLSSRDSTIQPYLKLGVGQLNREVAGAAYGSITGVLGAGLRISVLKFLAIRAEGTTYLTGGVLSTWRDNVALTGGLSVYF